MDNIDKLNKSHTVTNTELPNWTTLKTMDCWSPPKYVGYWTIGVMQIMLEKKPNWLHRFFMRCLLGIKWIDYATKETNEI